MVPPNVFLGSCSSTSVGDVFKDGLRVNSVRLSNLRDTLAAEGTLGVDVADLSVVTAHVAWELSDDRHGMADLSLAATELAVQLGDRTGLDTAAEDRVEVRRAGGEAVTNLHFGHQLDLKIIFLENNVETEYR